MSLQALLAEPGCVAAPGVHDVISAKIAARAGHRALYLGGNAMALGLGKGQPFLTLTETVEIAARVVRATDVPVIVDAGAGFGLPSHLDLSVRDIAAVGAAALHIDDQPYPKSPDYHRGRGELVTPDAMAARIRTAVAGRGAADMLILARTDALRVTGSLNDAIERARACVEAGADGIIVLDLGPDQAPAVARALPGVPLVWIGGVTPPVPSVADLGAAGFALGLYPFNGIAALGVALGDLWTGLAETGGIDQSADLLARARRDTLGLADMAHAWAIEDGQN
ncbi:isocitrate lyase/PEP mutase family protein [Sphingomonas profundi]|uniref:isocitrate lyase/PEP mutase family protein n=1 Tax=Alterirhizorhabdus profundi TaxID=2681549 RepID=UPI0012E96398|nr:isocitrate lyase/PEP mutase family protein [Sphingomonas profundi]